MDYFVGLDVSLRTVAVCVIDTDGQHVFERIAAKDPDRQTAETHFRIALITASTHSAPPRSSASPKFGGERGSQASRGSSTTMPWYHRPEARTAWGSYCATAATAGCPNRRTKGLG